ncbi:unnamed protein product [Prorocentrum cordatum]|uniref:Uncharacterized protein n=1 Tax=Prorocentrum cordatum TaxID=2364126 RepID=A0ABN9PYT8_9DINO|nr:unnamed protein product [Polarella glacialis]
MVSFFPPVLGLDVESRIALLEAAGFDRKAVLKMASSHPPSARLRCGELHCPARGGRLKAALKMASSHPPVPGYGVESRIALLRAAGCDRKAALKMASSSAGLRRE